MNDKLRLDVRTLPILYVCGWGGGGGGGGAMENQLLSCTPETHYLASLCVCGWGGGATLQ